mgnify:CR=1 FL=1
MDSSINQVVNPPARGKLFHILIYIWALSLIGTAFSLLVFLGLGSLSNEWGTLLGFNKLVQTPILAFLSLVSLIFESVILLDIIRWKKWAAVWYLPITLLLLLIGTLIRNFVELTAKPDWTSWISSLIFPFLIFVCIRKQWSLFK